MSNSVESVNNIIKDLKTTKIINTKEISDTHHTIGDLYEHRCVLFSVICNQNKDIAWKSLLHADGTMFDKDSFVVGILTPKGQATYHYKKIYWDLFKVKELPNAPEWDGYGPKDVLERLISLTEQL